MLLDPGPKSKTFPPKKMDSMVKGVKNRGLLRCWAFMLLEKPTSSVGWGHANPSAFGCPQNLVFRAQALRAGVTKFRGVLFLLYISAWPLPSTANRMFKGEGVHFFRLRFFFQRDFHDFTFSLRPFVGSMFQAPLTPTMAPHLWGLYTLNPNGDSAFMKREIVKIAFEKKTEFEKK